MFKNRSVQMKIVKDDVVVPSLPKTSPAQYARLAREIGTDAVKGGCVLITTYVAADTLRRCALHIVATKIS